MMELAIFAVLVLGISAGVWGFWTIRQYLKEILVALNYQGHRVCNTLDNTASIMNVLTEASKRNALKAKEPETVFDKPSDKIPASGQRYIPVARRRAMAEAQSAGPGTHNDQVRANNAKVLETL